MYSRCLPPFPDLSAFLSYLDGKGELRTSAAPIDMNLEITEMHRRVIAGGGPVLRFENPIAGGRASSLPAVTNLFGTRERVAAGLGTVPAELERLGQFMAWMRSPQPPKSIAEAGKLFPAARAALQSRPKFVSAPKAWADAAADLSQLPVQTCWPGDAGPLITWPIVVTRAPGDDEPSTYNLGIYRMQVLDNGATIMRWLPMRGGAAHHRQWAAKGLDMPVAVVIGADPATILAAVMPAPEGVSELMLAGILGGRRPELAPCRTIPLHVPASAQIVLEGSVSPSETAMEGPFGDHTGYYNPAEPFPVFRLKHMRIREPGMYLTTFTGRAPDEPSVIGDAMLDIFKPLLRQQLPEILDVWLPPEACSYRIAVLKLDKRYPGQARRAMMGFWSLLPQFTMTKVLIAVDADIDIRSWSDVMWAVATRMDPSRDLMVLERTPIDHLDFASPLTGLGGKLGIDATNKIGTETTRGWGEVMRMNADVEARVSERWGELFAGLPGNRKDFGMTREPSIEEELDARHEAARAAFAKRDIEAYRAMFSPSLAYRQPDGRVIGRERLMRGVEEQFRGIGGVASVFSRERSSSDGDEATELLTQTVLLETSAFGLLHLRWKLVRRGEYTWAKANGTWAISRVEVLSEKIERVGWRLGF